jgi:hypothetical protein
MFRVYCLAWAEPKEALTTSAKAAKQRPLIFSAPKIFKEEINVKKLYSAISTRPKFF